MVKYVITTYINEKIMRSNLYLETVFDDVNGEPYKKIGPFKIYIKRGRAGKYRYIPRIDIQYIPLLPYFRIIYQRHPTKEDIDDMGGNISFGRIYNVLKTKIAEELMEIDEINLMDEDIDRVSELLFWEIIGLTRLAPFMLDDEIEEVFIDGVKSPVYLNHTKYGRCESDVILRREEMEALITHIELHKGISINYSKGNLESELETEHMHLRINIDLDPLAVGGPFVIMRNLRRSPYTLPDLIRNNTLNLEAAVFILTAAWTKLNITIAGEVNTGKTTLLNAIDMALPTRYRKVYIEDALESIDMRDVGRFQAFYRAETYSTNLNKRRQITFTLHRTPDIVIFGEVLTDDDVETLFYSLSCGLKGLQTIHARSVESLVRRWIIHHKMPLEALKDIDLIIFMKKDMRGRRYVEGIYEINIEDEKPKIISIFKRKSKNIDMMLEIRDTETYRKIIEELGSKEILQRLYRDLKDALEQPPRKFYETLEKVEEEFFGGMEINVRGII